MDYQSATQSTSSVETRSLPQNVNQGLLPSSRESPCEFLGLKSLLNDVTDLHSLASSLSC